MQYLVLISGPYVAADGVYVITTFCYLPLPDNNNTFLAYKPTMPTLSDDARLSL